MLLCLLMHQLIQSLFLFDNASSFAFFDELSTDIKEKIKNLDISIKDFIHYILEETGKNYGEIGAEARSMHKSQGEGRPRRRGSITEFFDWVAGDKAIRDIMDGVNTSWTRLNAPEIHDAVTAIVQNYKIENPEFVFF